MDELSAALVDDLEGSFQGLVEQTGSRIYWALRRMSNGHQEAEDLTQETFIRAYRALSGYDTDRIRTLRVEPWLWTIALNLGRNSLRDRARRPTFVEIEERPVDDPELADGAAWDMRLARLNSHQRRAVILRHVAGLGPIEIAEATGRPVGTVKADIHRGLARLREVMEDEE